MTMGMIVSALFSLNPFAGCPTRDGGRTEPPDQQGAGDDGHTTLAPKPKTQTKKPSMYKVLLLNDDYTPMEFVVQVLEAFFNKTIEEATEIMLTVHRAGVGLCGIYTYEVAETKVAQVLAAARRAQHPLQCTMEKE